MATIVVPSKPTEECAKPPKSVCLQDLSRVREEAGAYNCPLPSSTLAVLPSEPFFVQFVTSYDPSIY